MRGPGDHSDSLFSLPHEQREGSQIVMSGAGEEESTVMMMRLEVE